MAIYGNEKLVRKRTEKIFRELHAPGDETPRTGIYRCDYCGFEVVRELDAPLPSLTEHDHKPGIAIPQWRLVVYAQRFKTIRRRTGG
jgi:hypothetical protein